LVKNFGPIRDLKIELKSLSVIIGEQSSGKSTVAKLFAMFSWLEKAIIRGEITEKGISRKGYIRARCRYHRIDEFFEPDTFIEYSNKYYRFVQRGDKLDVFRIKNSGEVYSIPQITYFPTERGILSVLHPIKDSALTEPLVDLRYEFDKAKNYFFSGFKLPWGDIFEYNRQNKISYIRPKDSKRQIRLSSSSSGTQCALPLLLVAEYLSKMVYDANFEKSSLRFDDIRNDILKIYKNKSYSDETRNLIIQSLASKYKNSYLLNIVEEPEQNLFPSAQKDVFFDLLRVTNFQRGGRLFITTHSPYILTLLNCALKRGYLYQKYKDNESLKNKLNDLSDVPAVSGQTVGAYMLKNGKAIPMLDKTSALVSAELMDEVSDEISRIFDELLDFEISHENG